MSTGTHHQQHRFNGQRSPLSAPPRGTADPSKGFFPPSNSTTRYSPGAHKPPDAGR